MAKRKSKAQKKKFFSNPKNKNKIFKKKDGFGNSTKSDAVLRERGSFAVLDTGAYERVPHCPHGPCLLFEEKKKGMTESRYFSCAIFRRDPNHCSYKIEVDESNKLLKTEDLIQHSKSSVTGENFENATKPVDYGCIQKKLEGIPTSTPLVFCHDCVDVFALKHRCPSQVVTRAQLNAPTRLLAAKESESGEAQFYFSDECLGVLLQVVQRSGVQGVLCLGTPRLFEELRQKNSDRRLFLLDYDKRFARFFPPHQFGQYSMLVNHFYDEMSSRKLHDFLTECSTVLLVCDPPFGVFLNPLMRTIETLKLRHQDARGNNPAKFYGCIVIPMFVGKHILRSYKDYWMSDFRVTYENHKLFANATKTTIRCFTNLKSDVFDLSCVKGYKFCEFCERYVANENKHCFMCSFCTSKDGSAYKHCERCMRCVKISYYHCKKCKRCHLKGRCLTTEETSHENQS